MKRVLFFLGMVVFSSITAQEKDEVLLMLGESPIYESEFKRVYLKNIDLVKDASQKDVDEYLKLFIDYKLKLQEAKFLGLDKKETYQTELDGYARELSSNYLTDVKASDEMVREAYERMKKRIRASHILIQLRRDASPEDTLKAFKKITEARNKIVKGESFESIAETYSEDPSVTKNKGDLGWYSVFRMVYPFENASYQTKIGEISAPFRTQFGYHIVKVTGQQPYEGKVTVAHILAKIDEKQTASIAAHKIKEIKQQLEDGVAFDVVAKQYSDDKQSAPYGGELKPFEKGVLNSEAFENAAFTLKEVGELSQPIKTQYGLHILKLLNKEAVGTYEEEKSQLTERIKRDTRAQLITDKFLTSLKKKYGVEKNEEAILYFKKIATSITESDKNSYPKTEAFQKVLFKIKDKEYAYKDFASFLFEKQYKAKYFKDLSKFIDRSYDDFESQELLAYYKNNLERDNQEFANVLLEYREGLLLFDIMETTIWDRAKEDMEGVKKYYQEHKNDYKKGETYTVIKASSVNKKTLAKTAKLLSKGMSIDKIRSIVNKKGVQVIFSEEFLEKGVDGFPERFLAEKNTSTFTEEKEYQTLFFVKEIQQETIKEFETVKGKVINDYQQHLENIWLDSLRKKYQVKVDEKILNKVKKEFSI